jgi:hypothetical protein
MTYQPNITVCKTKIKNHAKFLLFSSFHSVSEQNENLICYLTKSNGIFKRESSKFLI